MVIKDLMNDLAPSCQPIKISIYNYTVNWELVFIKFNNMSCFLFYGSKTTIAIEKVNVLIFLTLQLPFLKNELWLFSVSWTNFVLCEKIPNQLINFKTNIFIFFLFLITLWYCLFSLALLLYTAPLDLSLNSLILWAINEKVIMQLLHTYKQIYVNSTWTESMADAASCQCLRLAISTTNSRNIHLLCDVRILSTDINDLSTKYDFISSLFQFLPAFYPFFLLRVSKPQVNSIFSPFELHLFTT